MNNKTTSDVLIIGGSFAGLSAALALGRARRTVLVIDSGKPCNQPTPHSHNFLTQDGAVPAAIRTAGKNQVLAYPTVHFITGTVLRITGSDFAFSIQTAANETYFAKKILFATGITDLLPAIPGFAACWGKSVIHCPFCHGYEVKDEPTGLLLPADNPMDYIALVANWTNQLTVFTNGTMPFSPEEQTLLAAKNIRLEKERIRDLQHSGGQVAAIQLENDSTVALKALYARVPFRQHTDLPAMLGCKLTDDGYIQTGSLQHTTVPGVFAAGDNASRLRTVSNAVAAGTAAGIAINKELTDHSFFHF